MSATLCIFAVALGVAQLGRATADAPDAEGLRATVVLPAVETNVSAAGLFMFIDGPGFELGYADTRQSHCGNKDGFRGFYSVRNKTCKPLIVADAVAGTRHRLEAQRTKGGPWRLAVDGAPAGVVMSGDGAARLEVALEGLPASRIGPLSFEKLEIRRRGKWRRWQPKALHSDGVCAGQVDNTGVAVTCEAGFGWRLSTRGEEACAVAGDGRVVCWFVDVTIGAMRGVEYAVEVAAGNAHTCVRTVTGNVACWGRNHAGQLGVPGDDRTEPVSVEGKAKRITSGAAHTCAVTTEGRVHCWGAADRGQLGDGSLRDVVRIEAGADTTCAIDVAGKLSCWGAEYHPGNRDNGGPAPREIVGLGAVEQVSVGVEHACAVRRSGGVACWGRRIESFEHGKLPSRRAGLRTIPGLTDATQVAAGRLHSCALVSDGRVKCWGFNRYGQLGDGTTGSRADPAFVDGLRDITAISAGRDHTCAIDKDRQAWCWGGRFVRKDKPVVRYGVKPRQISGLRL